MRGRFLLLMALVACQHEILPADCPLKTRSVDGVCRVTCAADSDCLYSESCSNQACLPRNPSEGPRVRLFHADRILVTRQDPTVHFDYVVTNANVVDLAPMPGSLSEHAGTVKVTVADSTDFQLIGRTTDLRQDSAVQRVQLVDDPPEGELAVSMLVERSQVEPCGAVDVQWTVVGNIEGQLQVWIIADGVEEIFRDSASSGAMTLALDRPRVLQLHAEAASASGTSEAIPSRPGKLCSLIATPDRVAAGDTALLEWEARGPGLVFVENLGTGERLFTQTAQDREGRNSGRWLVAPDEPTIYRVVAQGLQPDLDDELTVQIDAVGERAAPVIESFFAEPRWFSLNASVDISWSTFGGPSNTLLWNGMTEPLPGSSGVIAHPAFESAQLWLLSEGAGLAASARTVVWATTDEVEPNDLLELANPISDVAYRGSFDLLNLDVDRYLVEGGAPGPLRLTVFDPEERECADLTGARLVVEVDGNVRYDQPFTGFCPSLLLDEPQTVNSGYLITMHPPPSVGSIESVGYVLAADLAPITCGDNAVESREVCDDGNVYRGDGCDSDCNFELGYRYEIINGDAMLPPPPGGAVSLDFVPYEPGGDATDEGFAIIPADISYFGHRYAGLMVHVNGYVTLLPDRTVEAGLGSAAAPNAVIAGFGTDLIDPGGASILYWADLTPSGLHHVIAYQELRGRDSQGLEAGPVSFRIEIYESGEVHFDYDPSSFIPPGYVWIGGIDNATGRYAYPLKDCGEVCVQPPSSTAISFFPR